MKEVEPGEHVELVPGVPAPIQKLPTDVMQVSEQMVLLTWLAFGIAAFCLHKLLWKPILRAVESREQTVRDALDGAERARQELAETAVRRQHLLDQAAAEAQALADQAAREKSTLLARADQEAKALAQRRLDDAEREIGVARDKAAEAVRLDAAKSIGDLVERLLLKNLTEEQKRAYQADVLSEVKL
jgi:F-type H+-transporting ATPase subunit b